MRKSIFWVGGVILLGIIVALILIFSLKKPTYEVSFISDGKSILETLKVKEDGTIEEPKAPEKEGYVFEGWYSKNEKFDFSTKITEDIELEAKWTKKELKTYTITFDANGGNKISSIKVEENKTPSLPTPQKDGYKFLGWYDGNVKVTTTTKITEDMKLIAKWEKVVTSTTKKKTTTKKTTKTTVTTTKPLETEPTTTKIVETTTKKVEETTTTKKEVLAFELVKFGNSDEGQGILYLTKNGERVSGTCTIVTSTNEVVDNVSIDTSGYRIDIKFVKEVKNIKVN